MLEHSFMNRIVGISMFQRQKEVERRKKTTLSDFLFHMRLSYGYFNKNALLKPVRR